MSNIPPRMAPGYPVAQLREWLNALRDAVASDRVHGDSKTIRVQRTPGGTTVSAVPDAGRGGSAGLGVTWASVTAASGTHRYTANLFTEYGATGTALATGQVLLVPSGLHKFDEQFATGTVMPCVKHQSGYQAVAAPVWLPTGSTQYFLSAQAGELSWIEAAEFSCPS